MKHDFIRSGVSKRYKYNIVNKKNKLSSTQLVRVTSSISHHVSTSVDRLQASSAKCIKGIACGKFNAISYTYLYYWLEYGTVSLRHVAKLKIQHLLVVSTEISFCCTLYC